MGPKDGRLYCMGREGGGGVRWGPKIYLSLFRFFSFGAIQYVRGTHTPNMCAQRKDEGGGFLMV
jgi:hypothetical protein